jgi:hypothetical protein
VVAGAIVAAGVEALGADGPRAGVGAHVAALVALGCVAGGWLAGVVVGAVRPTDGGAASMAAAVREGGAG